MWKNIIKSELTEDNIENFVYSIEYTIEDIVATMFKKGYDAGTHRFGDYEVEIRKVDLMRQPREDVVSNIAFQYEFSFDSGVETLYFATCKIAGNDERDIHDLFFDTRDSEMDIQYSRDFIKQPNIREIMINVRNGLTEIVNKV